LRDIATPQEKYNAQIEKLNALLEKGKLNQEQYGRAVEQAKNKMEEEGQAVEKAKHAHAAAFGEAAISEVKSFASSLGLVVGAAELAKMAIEKMAEARREAAEEAKQAEMSTGSLAQLTNDPEEYKGLVEAAKKMYAGGGASSLEEANRTIFALKSAGMMGDVDLFTSLKGSGLVSELPTMAKSVRTLQASMGAEETGTTRQLLGKAFAAGEYAPSYAQEMLPAAAKAGIGARKAGIHDEEVLAAVALMAESSGSADLGGTRVAALMKALGKIGAGGVGETESGLEQSEESQAALRKEIFGAAAKAKFEQRVAGFDARLEKGHITQESRDAFVAKAQLDMDKEIEKASKGKGNGLQLQGLNLMQQLQAIQSLGLNEAALQKLFGRQEGKQAYEVLLMNQGRYGEAVQHINQANFDDVIGKKLGLTNLDPNSAAARQVRLQTAAKKVGAEDLGRVENLWQAAEEHIETRMRKEGKWEATIAARKVSNWALGKMPGAGTMDVDLRETYKSGKLDDDATLKHQVGLYLGLEKAAADLNAAARILKQPSPTLSKPDHDR
jgi:hypothetical protein